MVDIGQDFRCEVGRACAIAVGLQLDPPFGAFSQCFINLSANVIGKARAGHRAEGRRLVERIADDDQRPSLTGSKSFTEEVTEVLARRAPLYRRIAHVEVSTDGRAVEEIAAEIVRQVEA